VKNPVSFRALDLNSRARKHKISKYPNPQIPKAVLETQIEHPTLKNNVSERERESKVKIETWTESTGKIR
jgi:hypothetical protein